jgi:hypothetical protein
MRRLRYESPQASYPWFETSISFARQSRALPSLIEASANFRAEAKFSTRPPAMIAADALRTTMSFAGPVSLPLRTSV